MPYFEMFITDTDGHTASWLVRAKDSDEAMHKIKTSKDIDSSTSKNIKVKLMGDFYAKALIEAFSPEEYKERIHPPDMFVLDEYFPKESKELIRGIKG